MPPGWSDQSKEGKTIYCKVEHIGDGDQPPTVTRSLTLSQDETWVAHVHGKGLDSKKCTALAQFPAHLTEVEKQNQMIAVLDKLRVCPGNPDEKYLDLGDSRKGSFYDAHRNLVATVDSFFPVRESL